MYSLGQALGVDIDADNLLPLTPCPWMTLREGIVFYKDILFSFQLDTFAAVYKKLTGKDVNFEFPE